jgi:predicted nucleic acid-binding protein
VEAANWLHPFGFQVTRYLLDTNVIAELRKIKPQGAVVAWLEGLRVEQVFHSAVTIGRITKRCRVSPSSDAAKAREIESGLTSVELSFAFVPMDSACFREW